MATDKTFDDWLLNFIDHPRIQQAITDGRTITALRPDSDVLGATSGQAQLLMQKIPSWNPSMTDAFFIRLNPVAIKLTALRYHLRRYREIQDARLRNISANQLLLNSMKKGLKFCEMEMLHEVEALFSSISRHSICW